MKDFLLNFWWESKAMAKANPWKTGALVIVSASIGFFLGTL